MSKKITPKKTTSGKGKRTSASKRVAGKPQATRSQPREAEPKRSTVTRTEAGDRGAPIEHYHGEPNRGKKTGDPGSLDQETLDRDAPYNKTYGRLSDERRADS